MSGQLMGFLLPASPLRPSMGGIKTEDSPGLVPFVALSLQGSHEGVSVCVGTFVWVCLCGYLYPLFITYD